MIYDVAILGGGPAGYSAAFEAVKNGLSVVLFEEDQLGGTCLNRGCIPTKYLVHTGEIMTQFQNAGKYGITVEECLLDYKTTIEKMNSTVQQLREGLTEKLLSEDIIVKKGVAKLVDKNKISQDGKEFIASNVILATGSNPATPLIEGAHTSDDALALDYVPKTMKILGGGVIAVEFANIFNKLGCNVTMNIRGERILRKWDKELAVSITQSLKKDGINIKTKCTMEDFEDGNYDFVLSAVGRVPRTEPFAELEIELDETGAVVIDENGMTNLQGVYAAGDVSSGSTMLAHTAMEQGRHVIQHIIGKSTVPSAVSNCIYISPEVSNVGLTEGEAKERGFDVVTAKVNMMSNAMTLIHTDKRSFIKVVSERVSHKILGAQLMCERASDISSEFVAAINNHLTVEDIKNSLHPHPSFSEAIFDVMSALEEKLHEV